MSENNLKTVIIIFIGIFLLMFFFGRSKQQQSQYGDINIQARVTAADGLDLKAAGELIKQAKNAEDFEKLLNKPGGVNNLDLNEDSKVDYIHVAEYGNENAKGFSLTVQPAAGETQEIATLDIEKAGDKANVEIRGNEQIYGQNHYYHSSHLLTNFLLMSYLFSPHRMFMSPWGYGNYPRAYTAYRPVASGAYRSRANTINRTSTARRTSTSRLTNKSTSPNSTKFARKGIKAPLKNPTVSQKSFQARNPSRVAKRATGFGRTQRTSSSSRPSVRRGGFSRSRSSFGGK